ncbi:MAG: glucan biosynthesis protein, partial [Pseudomonadota bacterium]
MLTRRGFLGYALASASLPYGANATETRESFEAVARRLSLAPHGDPRMVLAPPFDALTYDSFRAIRPAAGGAADLPLGGDVTADLLPPGFYFQDKVSIEIARAGGVEPIGFDPALFSYGARYFDGPPDLTEAERAGMGFSGLRIRAPYRTPAISDEFFVTQGASYFRLVSRETLYGLSNRALAIGTGGEGPEEFPLFTRLRLHEGSAAHAGGVELEALIDSPSVTGAARLTIRPGEPTATDVDLVLFPRVDIADIGIAPLTSMYLKGPLRAAVSDDFRPRVHDSDVLEIANGAGERLLRPLSNPARLQTSSFADGNPRGFGLVQSARRFDDFEDEEAAYHRRPSAWVTPGEDWGAGRVMLVEIPTADEFFDNIVAFWRPEAPLAAGGTYRYSYRILTGAAPVPDAALQARVAQTRSGLVHGRPGHLQYVVDFAGDGLEGLNVDLSASQGTLHGVAAYPLSRRGHLRVGFQFEPGSADASELRLVLRESTGAAASDVWLH